MDTFLFGFGRMRRFSIVSKRTKATIVTTLVAVLVGGWAKYWFGPPEIQPIDPPATVAEMLAGSPISFAEWQLLAERISPDENSTFQEYLGREVVWEGFFETANRHDNGDANRVYSLILFDRPSSLNSDALLSPPWARCFFGVQSAPRIETLQKGDWIVLKGTIHDPLLLGSKLGTDLDNCSILAANAARDVSLAIAPDSSTKTR